MAPISTGSSRARNSSVSILEASAIWLSSRSSRFTSSPTSASSFARFSSSVDALGSLDGTEHGAERILHLVRHVGDETLDRVHAHPERLGHVPQRTGEAADLVVARREVGDRHLAPAAGAHPLRRPREPAHGPGDRAREVEAEEDGNPERDAERLQDGEAGVADAFQDVVCIRYQ